MSQHQQTVVWDIFVRSFHWLLFGAFVLAWLSEDAWLGLHVNAGYAVLLLILLRLIWGFIGSEHARFKDFVHRPAAVRAYLKDLLLMRARRYLGHNPAGGAMIVLLLASLLLTTVSGLFTYALEEGAGPLSGWIGRSAGGGDFMEEVHEFFANFTLLLVAFHVLGVAVESLLQRENLVKAMFNGKKEIDY